LHFTTLVQLQSPWSPTAVALLGSDVYLLEYLHTASEDRREWLPRVRKISPDGKPAVIATVARQPLRPSLVISPKLKAS
jgi:hypothetical protein